MPFKAVRIKNGMPAPGKKSAKRCLMHMTSTKSSGCILDMLYDVVRDRCRNPQNDSYVASLLSGGADALYAKIIEEAGELVAASRHRVPEQIVHEAADLWFHTIVLLGSLNIPPREIYQELERRWGTSGLQEKAAPAN